MRTRVAILLLLWQSAHAISEREQLYNLHHANYSDPDWGSSLAEDIVSNVAAPLRDLLAFVGAPATLPPKRFFPDVAAAPSGSLEGQFDVDSFGQETDQRRPLRRRCHAARGDWCGRFERQPRVPFKAAPRGGRVCASDCNGVGVCDYDFGTCQCPAGWTGPDCKTPEKRACVRGGRQPGPVTAPLSHVDADGRDEGWDIPGWSASRCGGICDTDTSQCFCDGAISKYGYIAAPKGSKPGTPPLKWGRPLSEYCKPKEDAKGKATGWGPIPYDRLYGPNGWCNADQPSDAVLCACQLDWMAGKYCDVVVESFCVNQCSGRGVCQTGFCKCYSGWYGSDCSRKRADLEIEKSDLESGARPWLAAVLTPPTAAATEAPALGFRKRPLIYVYDVPPEYAARMLQYRLVSRTCAWRKFIERNESAINDWIYGQELYIHEMLLVSPHRTYDPEEADYFYVPLYITCYFWPILGWADMPWWGAPSAPRPMQGANMMQEALRWIKQTHGKYWDRRQGRDHIWLMAHDEGACWAPTEIAKTSIILTHWGRMDAEHKSNTAYGMDNYNSALDNWKAYQPWDWRVNISAHACYDPDKDLVIPSLKPPEHYKFSPLLGHPPMQRDILLYFKGDTGGRRDLCKPEKPRECYSRGIRQTLHKLSVESKWREKYQIWIASSNEGSAQGSYSEQLARSLFCLVAPGDGWSARAEDAILHGCIPLVIMDNVHAVFESILDWDSFSVRIAESSIPELPHLLQAYTPEQISRMQRRLGTVWQRFAYAQSPVYQAALQQQYLANAQKAQPTPKHHPLPKLTEFPVQEDAFSTILQWLYARIPHTRGEGAAPASLPGHRDDN